MDGQLEWDAILAAARASGVHVLVLHDAHALVAAAGNHDGWDFIQWREGFGDRAVLYARCVVRFAREDAPRARRYGSEDDRHDDARPWLVWSWVGEIRELAPYDGDRDELPWWVHLLHEVGHAVAGGGDVEADAWGLRLARAVWGHDSPHAQLAADSLQRTIGAPRLGPASIEEAIAQLKDHPTRNAIAAAAAIAHGPSDRDPAMEADPLDARSQPDDFV